LVLLTLKQKRPKGKITKHTNKHKQTNKHKHTNKHTCTHTTNKTAKYVIWPRIDQKTCLKCISCAGLEPLVIENVIEGDEVRTNLSQIRNVIEKYGNESIVCVLSTTSCFAPRVPDKIVEISQICKV